MHYFAGTAYASCQFRGQYCSASLHPLSLSLSSFFVHSSSPLSPNLLLLRGAQPALRSRGHPWKPCPFSPYLSLTTRPVVQDCPQGQIVDSPVLPSQQSPDSPAHWPKPVTCPLGTGTHSAYTRSRGRFPVRTLQSAPGIQPAVAVDLICGIQKYLSFYSSTRRPNFIKRRLVVRRSAVGGERREVFSHGAFEETYFAFYESLFIL